MGARTCVAEPLRRHGRSGSAHWWAFGHQFLSNPRKSPVSGGDLSLNVTGEVCRGGGADHERHHSQSDPQPVRSCGAAAVRG
jgi:hypothetical protein